MTKPSRPVSQGRLAPCGSSLRELSALALAKPAMAVGVMAASDPPASMTSASPYWIMRPASPMAWVPVVHAVTIDRLGPFSPYMMERLPDIMLIMDIGT